MGLCFKQANNIDCRISAWGFEPHRRLAKYYFLIYSRSPDMSLSGKDPKEPGNDCSHNNNMARTSVLSSHLRHVLQTTNSVNSILNNLLLSPNQQPHPLVLQGQLQLAAWMVTGKPYLQMEFQSNLPNFFAPTLGREARQQLTTATAPTNSGLAGVVRGKLIHFAPLWPL